MVATTLPYPVTTTITYPIKEETIVASFVPQCVACERLDHRCIIMPNGTVNAGDYVCPNCLVETDVRITEMKRARANKKQGRLFK